MQTRLWSRSAVIDQIRDRIWLYLSPASDAAQVALEASGLLDLGERDALALARALYLMSDEVGAFLRDVPALLRRLPTSSAVVEERSMERVRGPVRWQTTLLERRATGVRNLYVTAPAERAFQTPENQPLVFLLSSIASIGQQLGWGDSKGPAGRLVSTRTDEALRLLSSRMFTAVDHTHPSPRQVSQVRTGRHSRRFATALSAYALHEFLVGHLDGPVLKRAVEQRRLVVQADDRLFEILCFFLTLDTLAQDGWDLPKPVVFSGGLLVEATKGVWRLQVHLQGVPELIRPGSRYSALLGAHGLRRSNLIPDLVLVGTREKFTPRVLLVELKMGPERTASESIREALQNLLAYEATYAPSINEPAALWGLGVVWGAGLSPANERIMLATVDHLDSAVRRFTECLAGTPDVSTPPAQ